MNPFPYSLDNKRYHTYNYYLKTRYDGKVAKVIIDGGFTCPNRDGSKGVGGCIFCSNSGSGDANKCLNDDILNQYINNKAMMDRKWDNKLYIPYFQSFSNTYGSLEKIQRILEPFIKMDEVAEISLATRADCLNDDILKYLSDVNKIKHINIELGLQSSNDNTAKIINRCHSFAEFKEGLDKLNKYNLATCIHVMNGLPFETLEDMYKTIEDISHLNFFGIKIHMLHVLKNTKLGDMYKNKQFPILTREEYIKLVVRQLEILPQNVVIERLTGDPIKEDLIAPLWVLNKTTILNDIDKLMLKENTWQGKYYR